MKEFIFKLLNILLTLVGGIILFIWVLKNTQINPWVALVVAAIIISIVETGINHFFVRRLDSK